MWINSPALYRLSYRGIYSVFQARNVLEGYHLYGCPEHLLARYCSKKIVVNLDFSARDGGKSQKN